MRTRYRALAILFSVFAVIRVGLWRSGHGNDLGLLLAILFAIGAAGFLAASLRSNGG